MPKEKKSCSRPYSSAIQGINICVKPKRRVCTLAPDKSHDPACVQRRISLLSYQTQQFTSHLGFYRASCSIFLPSSETIRNRIVLLLSVTVTIFSVGCVGECETTNSSCDSFDKMKYDHIIVKGLPYDRGLSHGIQAKKKIERSLYFYKNSPSFLPWTECVDYVKQHYLPAIEKYYKRGLEEMRGISAGAGVSLEDIVVLNARYDLSRVARMKKIKKSLAGSKNVNASTQTPMVADSILDETTEPTPGECTGAVALSSSTESGDILLGQNWDINQFILVNDTAILLEVHPDPSENIKPLIVLTEAGQLGRSGMNADGMAVSANGLWSTADLFERDVARHPYGWMPITLLRRMFLESPTFSLGIRNILQVPRHVSTNMIVATAEDEALDLEIVPDKYFVINVPTDMEILSHSNHFKSPAFLARDDIGEGSRGSSSLFRDRRVYRALQSYHPDINEESFRVAFQDHVGYPNSVCAHSVPPELSYTSAFPSETTVASVIYNLSKRTLKLTKGPPCVAAYQDYKLVKPELAIGGHETATSPPVD